jgi:hypothetical protein
LPKYHHAIISISYIKYGVPGIGFSVLNSAVKTSLQVIAQSCIVFAQMEGGGWENVALQDLPLPSLQKPNWIYAPS